MNTNIKHKILTGAMLFAAVLFGTSCEDSEGLKVTPETPFADKTLYEVIKADTQLSDFVEVLDSCGTECADSLFNQSRVYTLWAPTNGTFDKESIIAEIQAGKRDEVFQRFIMSHVANHLKAANGTLDEDNKILLLNKKVAVFTGDYINGYTFAGSQLTESNIRVWNGMLHKLGAPAEYRYSIWEYLLVDSRIDSVANFLYSFNDRQFNPGASILGPTVGGEQTYLDSVFTTSNRMLSVYGGVGNIDSEDSSYVVYIPSNEVWTSMVAKASRHFNYDLLNPYPQSMDSAYRDSLHFHYSRLNVIKYMAFSNYEQRYVKSPDSIVPAHRDGDRPLFARTQLDNSDIILTKDLSNGVLHIVNSSPYSEFELWHDTIVVEAETGNMLLTEANTTTQETKSSGYTRLNRSQVTDQNINKDSIFADTKISGRNYLEAVSDKAQVKLLYKIPGLLSASYKVAVVVVPKNITNELVPAEELLPTKYTFTLTRREASGSTKTLFTSPTQYNDPTRVDTMYLADKSGNPAIITIPYCELFSSSSHRDFNITLQVASARYAKGYDCSVRIDAIIFEPVADPE